MAALAGLAWVLPQLPWARIASALRELNRGLLFAAIGVAGLAICARALRLWVLSGQDTPYFGVLRCAALGYLASLLIPMGGGELVKATLLGREANLSLASAITSVAMDRMMDLALVLAMLGILVDRRMAHQLNPIMVMALGAGFLLLLGSVLVMRFWGDAFRQRLISGTSLQRLRTLLLRQVEAMQALLAVLRRPHVWGRLLGCQGLILGLDWLSVYLSLHAFPFGADLPWRAPAQVAVSITLAFALPLLPGSIGSHQAACILALAPFGIHQGQALAFSVAGHGAHVFLVLTLGLGALMFSRSGTWERLKGMSAP